MDILTSINFLLEVKEAEQYTKQELENLLFSCKRLIAALKRTGAQNDTLSGAKFLYNVYSYVLYKKGTESI